LKLWVNEADRKAVLKELSAGRQVVEREFQFRMKSGEVLTGLFTADMITINNEPWILASIIDITGRKQAEEALKASDEMSRNIIESAQDAVMILDNNGNISSWNRAAKAVFGYTEKEVLGKELHVLLAPKRYYDAYRKAFSNFQKTGEGAAVGKTLELAAVRKDGTEFPMELSMSAFRLKGMWCAAGIVRDITERKKMEKEARKRLQELEVFYKASVGREERIIELKKEIEMLKKELVPLPD